MVLAYHLIISAYGFWLPNDERGSWSDFVRSYELAKWGPATKVDTRASVAHRPYDRERRRLMKQSLAHRAVRFTGMQARAIASGFHDYCDRTGCIIHACAILPNHVHLVVARHRIPIERTCERLKASATTELTRHGLHPFAQEPYNDGRLPSPWARKGWWVYLSAGPDILRAIRYVDSNPVRDGMKAQHWALVTQYDARSHHPPVSR